MELLFLSTNVTHSKSRPVLLQLNMFMADNQSQGTFLTWLQQMDLYKAIASHSQDMILEDSINLVLERSHIENGNSCATA